MTASFEPRDGARSLETRAAAFIEADDWAGLCEDLGRVEVEVLAESPRAAYAYGEGLYRIGRPRELATFADRLEAAFRRDAEPRGLMKALNMSGVAAFELGEMSTASAKFGALVELAHAEHDDKMLAPAMNNLGAIADLQGRSTEAVGYYHRAIPLFETHDRPHGVAQAYHNLGLSYRERGHLTQAIESHRKAAAIADAAGHRPLVALALSARAECEIHRRDVELAEQLTVRSLRLARELGDPLAEGEARRVRGLARAARGDLEPALADLSAAEAAGRETGNSLLEAESLRDGGRCLVSAGRAAEGRIKLERAAAAFGRMGASHKAAALRAELTAEA